MPYANAPGARSINGDPETNEGYLVGVGPKAFTVTGVTKGKATGAQVVLNSFTIQAGQPQVSVNGGAYQTIPWATTDATYTWRSLSIPVPLTDVTDGANTITFKSSSGSTVVTNVSLIMVAAAAVP